MGVAALWAIAAVAAGSAVEQNVSQNKARREASERARKDAELRRQLANQSKAPITRKKGEVELESEESLEDEAIRRRSKKSRLRVGKADASAGGTSGLSNVGTGLKVG